MICKVASEDDVHKRIVKSPPNFFWCEPIEEIGCFETKGSSVNSTGQFACHSEVNRVIMDRMAASADLGPKKPFSGRPHQNEVLEPYGYLRQVRRRDLV